MKNVAINRQENYKYDHKQYRLKIALLLVTQIQAY